MLEYLKEKYQKVNYKFFLLILFVFSTLFIFNHFKIDNEILKNKKVKAAYVTGGNIDLKVGWNFINFPNDIQGIRMSSNNVSKIWVFRNGKYYSYPADFAQGELEFTDAKYNESYFINVSEIDAIVPCFPATDSNCFSISGNSDDIINLKAGFNSIGFSNLKNNIDSKSFLEIFKKGDIRYVLGWDNIFQKYKVIKGNTSKSGSYDLMENIELSKGYFVKSDVNTRFNQKVLDYNCGAKDNLSEKLSCICKSINFDKNNSPRYNNNCQDDSYFWIDSSGLGDDNLTYSLCHNDIYIDNPADVPESCSLQNKVDCNDIENEADKVKCLCENAFEDTAINVLKICNESDYYWIDVSSYIETTDQSLCHNDNGNISYVYGEDAYIPCVPGEDEPTTPEPDPKDEKEDCNNGIDDDNDGKIDCFDTECVSDNGEIIDPICNCSEDKNNDGIEDCGIDVLNNPDLSSDDFYNDYAYCRVKEAKCRKVVVLTFDDLQVTHENLAREIANRGFGATFLTSRAKFNSFGNFEFDERYCGTCTNCRDKELKEKYGGIGVFNFSYNSYSGEYKTGGSFYGDCSPAQNNLDNGNPEDFQNIIPRYHDFRFKRVYDVNHNLIEIGNHTHYHSDPLTGNSNEIEWEHNFLKEYVPEPKSFAWPGNSYSQKYLGKLKSLNYEFGRRGQHPTNAFVDDCAGLPEDLALVCNDLPNSESKIIFYEHYGKYYPTGIGPLYDPYLFHRLVLPTSALIVPECTIKEDYIALSKRARGRRLMVLQAHVIPNIYYKDGKYDKDYQRYGHVHYNGNGVSGIPVPVSGNETAVICGPGSESNLANAGRVLDHSEQEKSFLDYLDYMKEKNYTVISMNKIKYQFYDMGVVNNLDNFRNELDSMVKTELHKCDLNQYIDLRGDNCKQVDKDNFSIIFYEN